MYKLVAYPCISIQNQNKDDILTDINSKESRTGTLHNNIFIVVIAYQATVNKNQSCWNINSVHVTLSYGDESLFIKMNCHISVSDNMI